MKQWIKAHPDLWQFILFNILSNCATVTNFIVMWICTSFVFTSLADRPFSFLIFNNRRVPPAGLFLKSFIHVQIQSDLRIPVR